MGDAEHSGDTADPGRGRGWLDQLVGAEPGDQGWSEDDLAGSTHWPSIPSADAGVEWAELRAWVERLRERFVHLDHHVIPYCWWRHNAHVEALSALRDHERSSFSATAPATAATDWFRALRDITALLHAWTGEAPCGAEHVEAPTRLRAVEAGEWDRFVAADVAHRQADEVARAAQA